MSALNCKPQQLAWIARRCLSIQCVANMQGLPVQVDQLYTPMTMRGIVAEMLDGPLWMLVSPVRCAQCGTAFQILPDSVLRPFKPDSEPKDEETEAGKSKVVEFTDTEGVPHG